MNNEKLSKLISHALRHEPLSYNLLITEQGWVYIDELVKAIREIHLEFSNVTEADIVRVVNNADKKRHEIKNGQIKALYGHSIAIKDDYSYKVPPEFLYHGTTQKSYSLIKKEGLKRMQRQYVHLSISVSDARKVAFRRDEDVVVIKIKAKEAFGNGIVFYNEGDIWLSKYIPPQYLSPNEE